MAPFISRYLDIHKRNWLNKNLVVYERFMLMKLSIVVPCFNEEQALPLFYKETTKVLQDMQVSYEIILVNDGSTDRTQQVAERLSRHDQKVKYLTFSRNFGKEAAMYSGLINSKGDYIAIMDADLQDPPSLLPKMIQILDSGEYGSVATRRENREGEPLIRSWFARLFYKLINCISDVDIVDGARDFRLMTRQMVEAVLSMSERNRFSKGIFGWVGFNTYWLPYENIERVAGQTKWSFWRLTKYAIDGIINFSSVPLSVASWGGVGMTCLSFLMLMLIVIRKLIFGDPVAGWASLICVMLFIGGFQLLCLGIIGQYLAKIYMETKSRPHYIVAKTNVDEPIIIR